jgi:nicotinamide-nucleotide amidase
MRIDRQIYALAVQLGQVIAPSRMMVAAAESCTGGLVAGAITAVPGSSAWFERGFVTYSNEAKQEQLGVPEAVIEDFGAVSTETAQAMAQGALRASRAQWSVAVTGIAGPSGGSVEKPVGTVCFAWASSAGVDAVRCQLDGDRADIRRRSVIIALEGLIDRLA